MTTKELLLGGGIIVGVIGVTVLCFRSTIIGWLGGGGGSIDGKLPDTEIEPASGSDRDPSHGAHSGQSSASSSSESDGGIGGGDGGGD